MSYSLLVAQCSRGAVDKYRELPIETLSLLCGPGGDKLTKKRLAEEFNYG